MDNDDEINESDDSEESKENEIEVVTGDISKLDFSPVHEHLLAARAKPTEEKKKQIIIPEVKPKPAKNENDPNGNKVTIIMDDDDEEEDIVVSDKNNYDEDTIE